MCQETSHQLELIILEEAYPFALNVAYEFKIQLFPTVLVLSAGF